MEWTDNWIFLFIDPKWCHGGVIRSRRSKLEQPRDEEGEGEWAGDIVCCVVYDVEWSKRAEMH